MIINANSTITLDKRGVNLIVCSNEQKILESRVLYNLHPVIRSIACDITAAVSQRYALTAFGHICSQCGNCCERDNILIQGADIFNIALKLGISAEAFRKKYLRPADTWNPWDGYLKLKRGKCPFLKRDTTGYRLCSIYNIRPLSCRLFQPVSPLCKKEPGFLTEYLKSISICGDEMTLTVEYPALYNSENKRQPAVFKCLIQDEGIKELVEKLKNALAQVEGNQIDLLETAVLKTQKIFNDCLNKIYANPKDESLHKKIKELREILDNLSQLIIKTPGAHVSLDDLWKQLRVIETWKKEGILPSPPCSQSMSEPCGNEMNYIAKLENTLLKSVVMFPEIITLHLDSQGEEIHYPLPLSSNVKVKEAVRNFVKTLVNTEGEKLQLILTKTDPPCYLCGECCSCFGVEIKPSDIRRIAGRLGISVKQFRKDYLKEHMYSWNRSDGCLKKKKINNTDRYYCTFLEKKKDGFFYCAIHQFKPEVCGMFPPIHSICRKINNPPHWFRLPQNIIRLELTPSKINLATYYTHTMGNGDFSIEWRGEKKLQEAADLLTEALREYPVRRNQEREETIV